MTCHHLVIYYYSIIFSLIIVSHYIQYLSLQVLCCSISNSHSIYLCFLCSYLFTHTLYSFVSKISITQTQLGIVYYFILLLYFIVPIIKMFFCTRFLFSDNYIKSENNLRIAPLVRNFLFNKYVFLMKLFINYLELLIFVIILCKAWLLMSPVIVYCKISFKHSFR